MPDLNPQQFFHGTRHAIKDGMVRPANDADKNVSEYSMGDPGDMSEGDHAFVTEDEHHAWQAANVWSSGYQRPRVYVTGDAPDKTPGPWHKDHPDFLAHHDIHYADYGEEHHDILKKDIDLATKQHQPEWGSPTGFPVRDRIDIMPGRQGTFPNVNWDRFTGPGAMRGSNANHPTDEQVRYGLHWDGVHDEAIRQNKANEVAWNPPSKKARLMATMERKPILPDPHKGQDSIPGLVL